MTVSSEINKSGPYTGNGVTTVFAYGFRILDASHIEVIRTEGGIDATVSPSAYSVSGVGSDSGNVVFSAAPAVGQSITIIRNVPFTQSTDLENQGAYYAETIEQSLDLAAMRDQQLAEELSRAVKVPVGRAPLDTDEAVEGLMRFADIYQGVSDEDLSVRVDGSALEGGDLYYNNLVGEYRFWNGSLWVPFSTVASVVTYRYLATSGQTVFSGADLNGRTPTSLLSGAILVHINGLSIIEGVDFEIGGGGSTVTLTTGAAVSDEIVITEFQQIPLSQLPMQVADDAAAAEASRIASEAAEASAVSAAAALGGRLYASRAEFEAAPVDPLVHMVFIRFDNEVLPFVRQPGANTADDIPHPDGSDWARCGVSVSEVQAAITAGLASAVSRAELLQGPVAFNPTVTFQTVGGAVVTYGAVRRGAAWRVDKEVRVQIDITGATVTKNSASGRLRIGFGALGLTPGALQTSSGQIITRNTAIQYPAGTIQTGLSINPGQVWVELTHAPLNGPTGYVEASHVVNGTFTLQLEFTFMVD